MGLKILHSADWHLDAPFVAFREEQRAYLKQAQLQIPRKIAMICRQENCQLVLLAGDLFDGAWSRDTLDIVRDSLRDCGCPVLITPGNHDPWGKDSPWQEAWPENVHIFTPELQSVVYGDLNCRVYGAGFARMDCGSLLKDFHAQGEEVYQIGLFHGDPTNVHSNYNPVTSREIRESGLTYLALGHVHSAGGLEVGSTVCGWPGCPMGRGWDELGPKGCLVAELGETVEIRPLDMELPLFLRETLEVEGGAVPGLDAILPPGGSRNFYQITLEGYGNPDVPGLYRKYQNCPNLELRDETVDPDRLWDLCGEDSLRGAYFEKLRQSAETADPELQKKILLAAEISRKLLEGREVQLP